MRKPRALLTQQGDLYYISQQLDLVPGVWGKGSNARRDLIRTEGWRKGQIKREEGRCPACDIRKHTNIHTQLLGLEPAPSAVPGGAPSWVLGITALFSTAEGSSQLSARLRKANPSLFQQTSQPVHSQSSSLPKNFGLQGLSITLRATQQLWSPHCQLLLQLGCLIFYNIISKGKVEKIKACLQCKSH